MVELMEKITSSDIKEARRAIKQKLRKLYEEGKITKKIWRKSVKEVSKADILQMLKDTKNDD
jgi:ribosomal protein L19E